VKRLQKQPETGYGRVPKVLEFPRQARSLFEYASTTDGQMSACWACPDTPCLTWTDGELTKQTPIPSPAALVPEVCPTNAITRGVDGAPVIKDEACISCGICVARCPVGALRLRTSDACAVVAPIEIDSLGTTSMEEFQAKRAASAASLSWPNWADDLDLLPLQMQRALTAGERLASGTTFRRLVRNVFLLTGDAARVRIDGDASAWAEVAVGHGTKIGIVEVESLGGDPDAFRRVITDVARISGEHGVDLSQIIPVIAVIALPNVRTDYYRLVSDAKRYLGVSVRTLPLAFFLLVARVPTSSALALVAVDEYCASEASPEVMTSIRATFGDVPSVPGVAPLK
jgi:ferredoxin